MNRSNDTIDRIREEVIKCKLCDLCTNRTNAVPGEGNSNATVMFIGEAPGRNEDDERRLCKNYLEREISIVSPKIICILGGTAYHSMLAGASILGNRGKFVERDGRLYFLTIHPAAIIYNNKLRDTLEKDLRTLVTECRRLDISI